MTSRADPGALTGVLHDETFVLAGGEPRLDGVGRERPPRRWVILGVGLCSQAAASVYIYGLPLLLPTLRRSLGLSLGARE